MEAIPNAPLKGQCSKHYFYGRDNGIEQFLLGLEGAYATIARKVQDDPTSLLEQECAQLRRFIFLQSLRTEAAVRRISAAHAGMNSAVFRDMQAEHAVFTDQDIILLAMRIFHEAREIVGDLKTCILINRTKCDFITSDDPAIVTNRFHMQRLGDGNFGWSNSGVLLFLPLTPQYAFMCYDGLVYTVPNKDRGTVNVADHADAATLNEFQALNCNRNLYFANWDDRVSVLAYYNAVESFRLASRHFIEICVEDVDRRHGFYRLATEQEQAGRGPFLLRTGNVYPPPRRWPSILRFRQKPRTFSNGTAVGHVRKAEWLTRDEARGW